MGVGHRGGTGSDRGVRAVHRVRGAVAAATGASGLWRNEFARLADFSRRFLERMAVDGHIAGGAGAGDAGGVRHDGDPEAQPTWLRAGDTGGLTAGRDGV